MQDQFVHWVPSPSLVHYDGYHQRAMVLSEEGTLLTLSIPQGSQGRGWPVGTCQIVDNVPYSASGEPDTCECGQFTTRQTYEAYKAQHGDERGR